MWWSAVTNQMCKDVCRSRCWAMRNTVIGEQQQQKIISKLFGSYGKEKTWKIILLKPTQAAHPVLRSELNGCARQLRSRIKGELMSGRRRGGTTMTSAFNLHSFARVACPKATKISSSN